MSWRETPTSWIDEKTGLEWEKAFETDISQYNAEKKAQTRGKRLPTREEFIAAERHGIRKLERMEWKGLWFWSGTPYPGYGSRYAYAFSGDSGDAGVNDNRDSSYGNVAARCVSPAGQSSGVKVDSKLDSLPERVERAKALLSEVMELLK